MGRDGKKRKKGICIKPLTLIASRPGERTEEFGQITVLLEELVTTMLSPNFDLDRVDQLVSELGELGCPRAEVETWILSLLAYHEASRPLSSHRDWKRCCVKWFRACEDFGISRWSVGQAIRAGQHIRAQLHGQRKEEIQTAIYAMFFINKEEIAHL